MAALSACALVGFLFLDWFGRVPGTLRVGGNGVAFYLVGGESGWHSLGWAALAACVLAIVAGLALAALSATHESPVLPVAGAVVASFVAALALLALLIQVIAQPGPDQLVEVKSGWWLGLISCFGILSGSWMALRDDHTPHARVRKYEIRPAPQPPPQAPVA